MGDIEVNEAGKYNNFENNNFDFKNFEHIATVKPVENDYSWYQKIVAIVNRGSLFRDNLRNKRIKENLKATVAINRLLLVKEGL